MCVFKRRGVTVALEQEVTAFRGGRRLESLETKDGLRLDVDLAVVGVGVAPNVAFLDGSGIVVENGVVVDERLRTNVPGVHAAGDVANFFDPVFGRHRRIEHWSNANRQGAQAGTLLAHGDASPGDVSSFFSEVFGVTIKVFGDLSRFDDVRTEGDLESGLVATYGRGGRLVAALTVGQGDKVENRVKSLIRERAPARSLHESVMAA